LIDNFCGVGTILCEGALQGLEPHGGDIDDEAVRYAEAHLRALSQKWVRNVNVLDARSSKLPADYFDLAVSNIPWGEQLDLNAVELYSQAIPEYARVLKDEGAIVIVGPKPDLVEKHLKENFPEHNVGQFRLGFLGQHPWVNFAYPDSMSLNMS
jgi:tRNA G10  N-methylase Trm11